MILDMIQEWFKELLIDGIISNLTGMFDTLNTKVGEIAGEVSMTPAAWNSSIFNMIRNLSETVIVPIAGIILTFVMCYELIQLIIEKNNLHDFDTWIFFKWIFKTFCAVLIVTNTFIMLMTQDNVIICDPEDEYSPLVKRLGGQVIRLSPSSTDYVNPLDINLNYSDEENPLALKSDFVLSFCELIMGSKTGLEAIEKTVIDRAVQKIYQPYFADPRPENMPILGDLMEALLAQGIPEADRVAQALDLYVNGSLNFFNHRTTVDIRNRLVCFDIKGLGKNLKKPGMLIVQDAV